MDGRSAERAQVDAQRIEKRHSFVAQEFAADLVMRNSGLFNELDSPSAARKMNGESRAGGTADDDERLRFAAVAGSHHGLTRETHRRPGRAAKMSIGNRVSPARWM